MKTMTKLAMPPIDLQDPAALSDRHNRLFDLLKTGEIQANRIAMGQDRARALVESPSARAFLETAHRSFDPPRRAFKRA